MAPLRPARPTNSAVAAKRSGVTGGGGGASEPSVTVYITRTGTKYHAAGCRYAFRSRSRMPRPRAMSRARCATRRGEPAAVRASVSPRGTLSIAATSSYSSCRVGGGTRPLALSSSERRASCSTASSGRAPRSSSNAVPNVQRASSSNAHSCSSLVAFQRGSAARLSAP